MLDRVSTTVLGLDGRGNAAVFADYPQWEQWFLSGQTGAKEESSENQGMAGDREEEKPAASGKKKLSYLEAREFATIEERVETADARLQAAQDRVNAPEVAVDASKLTEALGEMESAQSELDALYARWAELSEKAG
jgi:ATP-binding cassette subfamily F protein uup